MKTKAQLFLMSVLASGACGIGPSLASAMPLAVPGLDRTVEKTHAMRVCDDDGDCWWSYRHHHGRWDEDRDWRRGERFREDHYGRAPHRDFDRDRDRDFDRDRDRDREGRMDKDRDDRERSARDESKSGKEYRGGKEMKEHGGRGSSGGTTGESGQTQSQGGKKD